MSTSGDGQDDRLSFETANESRSASPDIQNTHIPQRPSAVVPPNGLATDKSRGISRSMSARFARISQLPQFHEQRHPGKEGARLSRSTRLFEPELDRTNEKGEYAQLGSISNDLTGGAVESNHAKEGDDGDYLKGWPLAFVIIGICMAVFLVSIDRTIITTAIPYITREFRSTKDIGWYGSAYLLTACAFQPVFGRVYLFFSIKYSYLFSVVVFEIGSLICGIAPNSAALIAGRAVAGFGSAGILTGSFVLVATAVPLQKRPVYTAIVGMMFGVGATSGPLLGGVFTDLVTWRWCFYLNLPVGGAIILACLFFLRPNAVTEEHTIPWVQKIMNLDLFGNILFLGAAVMLFLALEFTTMGEAWGSAMIIGLLCGFATTFIAFVVWLWWRGDDALIPPSIITQRSVAGSCILAFFIYSALLAHTYFLPIWFQAVLGKSALQSGVDMIPYFVVNAVFSFIAGVFVSVVGYYVPPCLIGNAIATVGCGLLTRLSPSTSTAEWAGYEVLVAAGFGLSIQQGFTAVQTVLPRHQVSIGTAAVVACQSFGGAIFVSAGNSIFQNQLIVLWERQPVPGVDIRNLISSGATAFRDMVPESVLPDLIIVYNDALRMVFLATIPLAGLAFFATFLLEWKSVKAKPST